MSKGRVGCLLVKPHVEIDKSVSIGSVNRALVLMSGGIDSTACALFLTKQGYDVRGLFIDYGQPAARYEALAVGEIGGQLGIDVAMCKLLGGPAFGAGEITGRNAFFVFTALLVERNSFAELLALGIHAGTPYYDCSEAFLRSISRIVHETTGGNTQLIAPFITWTKMQVYGYFLSLRLPKELTYSCEAGLQPPCGACASCADRLLLDAC